MTDSSGYELAAIWNGSAGSFVNFHPSSGGFNSSRINALSSNAQGGRINDEAAIWHGSAENFTRLAPFGNRTTSEVLAMTETMQGGWFLEFSQKAVIWEGNRDTMQILHPPSVHGTSEVKAMIDDYQIGRVESGAALWRGSAESWINLHDIAVGQLGTTITSTSAVDAYKYEGEIFIVGSVHMNGRNIAAIWHQEGIVIEFPEPRPPNSKLANLSGRAIPGNGEQAMIAGVVVDRGTDSTVPLIFRGIGPTLRDYGVNNALNDPRLSIRNGGGILVEENAGWLGRADSDQIRSSASALGAFALSADGNDSAILHEAEENLFTVQLDDEMGSSGVGLIEIYIDDRASETSGLKNLSLRAFAGDGEAASIAGFVIKNDSDPEQPAIILLRVIGPTMGDYGLISFMPDPILTLRTGSGEDVITTDNWGDVSDLAGLQEAMSNAGAFTLPVGSLDAAALVELKPGSYTLTATDKNGASGVVLMEIYIIE